MQADYFDSDIVRQQAVVAGFSKVEDYLISLVEKDRERQAIKQGLDEVQAGLCRPYTEFDVEFRQRHSIDSE